MGRRAWVPSPCPLPGLSLLLLLLLLPLAPHGARPRAGRVSADPITQCHGLLCPLWLLRPRPGRAVERA